MNMYLKIFLATGIPFGVFAGAAYGYQVSFPWGIGVGIMGGFSFGVAMALILGYIQKRSLKKQSDTITTDATGVKPSQILQLRSPFENAFDVCQDSIKTLQRGKVQSMDRQKGEIKAKAGITWKSYGEIVEFNLRQLDDDHVEVKISSKPALPTTLVDYGKNQANVETLVDYIKRHAQVVDKTI